MMFNCTPFSATHGTISQWRIAFQYHAVTLKIRNTRSDINFFHGVVYFHVPLRFRCDCTIDTRGRCNVISVSKCQPNRDRYRSSFGSISLQVPLRQRARAGSMNVQRMRLHARGLSLQMQRKGLAFRTSTKPPPT